MATIVNNPPANESQNGNNNFLIGIILLIFFLILFFFYGLPALSNATRGPQINVPSSVDVNLHNSK